MAIDQRLMMGIIFIIAGVALALLAYAAFLYRRAPAELEEAAAPPDLGEDKDPEVADAGERNEGPSTTDEMEISMAHEGAEAETEIEPSADVPEDRADAEVGSGQTDEEIETETGAEAELAAGAPESRGDAEQLSESADEEFPEDLEPDLEQAQGILAEADMEVKQESAPATATVNLSQSPVTGRLVVEVEGRTFSSAQDLRDSDEWKQVGPILRDAVAWLSIADLIRDERQEPRESSVPEMAPSSMSMVEQINLILERKLERGETSTRAVRLVEGAGGSIRVYIGVSSYPIDEVPDAEVERLIREAVAEWESQQ